MKKKILLALSAIFIIMQFFPINKKNPPVNPALDFAEIHKNDTSGVSLLKAACYDCHSHESVYPWYSNLAPVSWWLKSHINGAREHVNFSSWGKYPTDKKEHILEEILEEVEVKNMPLKSYTWLHPSAKLTSEQRTQLLDFIKKSSK